VQSQISVFAQINQMAWAHTAALAEKVDFIIENYIFSLFISSFLISFHA
jgi:hypothetical protein